MTETSQDSTIRVVDFSTHVSGPLCTHLLTELGANVVKVEHHRHGDGNRDGDEVIENVHMFHATLNSGARSIAVNSRSPEWPRIVEAAAKWADVVVVGTRPSAARKRGIDFASIRSANPRVVYCLVSGFGTEGPWQDLPAHGQTIDGFAGLLQLEDGDPQPRTRAGWRTSGTTLGGMFAALGILAALHKRDRGVDHAQFVSVSIWQAALWWGWRDLAMLANAGRPWLDYSDLGARYSFYKTKDDRVLLLAPIEKRFWEAFCDLVDLGERKAVGTWETTGMCYGNGPEYDEERQLIADRLRLRTADEWSEAFQAADIPFAPALTLQEAMESEHATVNGVMRETSVDGQPISIPSIPVRFASEGEPEALLPALSPPPNLGEHTEEFLEEIGVDA